MKRLTRPIRTGGVGVAASNAAAVSRPSGGGGTTRIGSNVTVIEPASNAPSRRSEINGTGRVERVPKARYPEVRAVRIAQRMDPEESTGCPR